MPRFPHSHTRQATACKSPFHQQDPLRTVVNTKVPDQFQFAATGPATAATGPRTLNTLELHNQNFIKQPGWKRRRPQCLTNKQRQKHRRALRINPYGHYHDYITSVHHEAVHYAHVWCLTYGYNTNSGSVKANGNGTQVHNDYADDYNVHEDKASSYKLYTDYVALIACNNQDDDICGNDRNKDKHNIAVVIIDKANDDVPDSNDEGYNLHNLHIYNGKNVNNVDHDSTHYFSGLKAIDIKHAYPHEHYGHDVYIEDMHSPNHYARNVNNADVHNYKHFLKNNVADDEHGDDDEDEIGDSANDDNGDDDES